MADWVTISSLATAGGTLVLAMATFGSVRSANRAARVAERSLLVGLRPLLVTSRFDDPVQKVGFADGKWLHVPGGGGVAEASDEAVLLALSLRNVGSGIAVLHSWRFSIDPPMISDQPPPEHEFHRLSRDLYVAVNDVGFWQGTFRDPESSDFSEARAAIEQHSRLVVDLLYGDHEGGQRVISRFGMTAREDDGGRYIVSAARHWHIDHPDPR